MRAAVITEFGSPRCAEFAAPSGGDGGVVVEVRAASVNHVDLLKCGGAFYRPLPPFPWVAGTDGVGVTPDGRRVYFDESIPPYGSMGEQTLVEPSNLFDVAAGTGDAVAAALGNAGLAAWLALEWAARLEPGETVLVLGATGAVGELAVQLARRAGAGLVVAAGRSSVKLDRVRSLGADAVIELDPLDSLTERIHDVAADGIDVTVDPLWGEPALSALGAAAKGCRHVQIGHIAGPVMSLPAVALRATRTSLIGFAIFHAPIELRRSAYLELTQLAAGGDLAVDLEKMPLAAIESAWQRQRKGAGTKLVITP